MKLFKLAKDGGPLSEVWGFFFVEIKGLFSVVGLHFYNGARDAYHTHAFDAVSWVFRGRLVEQMLDGTVNHYGPSLRPIFTPRDTFHKVVSIGDTWAISFRGPWRDQWKEFLPDLKKFITLTHGRKQTD